MLLNYILVIFLSYLMLAPLLLFELYVFAFGQERPAQLLSILGQCGLKVELSALFLQVLLILLLFALTSLPSLLSLFLKLEVGSFFSRFLLGKFLISLLLFPLLITLDHLSKISAFCALLGPISSYSLPH